MPVQGKTHAGAIQAIADCKVDSWVVSRHCLFKNHPGAINLTIHSAFQKITEHKVMSIPSMTKKERLISLLTSCLESTLITFTKVGIKAALRAPSANILRSELGILYAVKKASERGPAPKNCTSKISRIRPNILLSNVELPTSIVFFKMLLRVAEWDDETFLR